jgi:heptosyltransferase-2
MAAYKPRNIVVFLPNWVGDVVMATPALGGLRKQCASARITFVGKPTAIDTLEGLGLCDATIIDGMARSQRVMRMLNLATCLRHRDFDMAVLLPNSFRSALTAKLAGIRRIVGYARDGRGWMLQRKLSPPRGEDGRIRPYPTIDYYNNLMAMLGARDIGRRMRLVLSEQQKEEAGALLAQAGADQSRPLVMLNPGGSFGPSKLWSAERYAAVADGLTQRYGAQIIINIAPGEESVGELVRSAMRTEPLIDFTGKPNSLSLLKGLVARCNLLITNDTGARHFAAALGVDVVTIFGSTNPVWAQIDYPRERIVRADLPCSPCQQKICPQPAGPKYHQCMAAITVDMVLSAAGELLQTRHSAGQVR